MPLFVVARLVVRDGCADDGHMKQITLAAEADGATGFERYRKPTRRDVFLAEMQTLVPWVELVALIEPHLTDLPLHAESSLTTARRPTYHSSGGPDRPRNTTVLRISSTGDKKTRGYLYTRSRSPKDSTGT